MKEQLQPTDNVRDATWEDLYKIHDFIQLGVKDGTLLPRTIDEIEGKLHQFVVYEEHGKVGGCAGLDIYTPKIAEIRSVYVDKDFRGRGIAGQLVRKCVEKARMYGIKELITITERGHVFREQGFSGKVGKQYILFQQL